jgi:alpha-methylacyl-CoA racemase
VTGPLRGVRVVEFAGIGPGPFCGMLLADLGADVVRVDRTAASPLGAGIPPASDVLGRGRRSVALDLKHPDGVAVALQLVGDSDVVLEGWRPGVAERLGVGPDACIAANPRIVYGRMTGWGQDGPWAPRAGHDIDYIALAGALHPVGPASAPPPPPLNYVGDFGGGGMLLALGIVAALVERSTSGAGQVVDAAMVDGAALQTAMVHGMLHAGLWRDARSANLLDGAAPFYRCYSCADGRFVAVGALEPAFYAELVRLLGLSADDWPQYDLARWPQAHAAFAERFASRTRDEWAEVFEGSDACVAPVLSLTEAPEHPHNAARATFVDAHGIRQPAPAPRFGRTPAGPVGAPTTVGAHTDEVLAEVGLSSAEVAALRARGAVG